MNEGASGGRSIKLMKRWSFVPKRIITDKLRSYGTAKREFAPGLDHWSHKGLNNRAENSHLPFRKRELEMQGFQSRGRLERFVSIQSATRNSFYVPARRRSALTIPGVEIRGTCRLINDRHADLKSRRVNVKTPR